MKVMSNDGMFTIYDSTEFDGVMFGINDIKFVDDSVLKIDYDVYNLQEGKEAIFEKFIGDLVLTSLEELVKEDARRLDE